MEHSLSDYVDIRYLDPAKTRFEETPGGFVRLTIDADEVIRASPSIGRFRSRLRTALSPCEILRGMRSG